MKNPRGSARTEKREWNSLLRLPFFRHLQGQQMLEIHSSPKPVDLRMAGAIPSRKCSLRHAILRSLRRDSSTHTASARELSSVSRLARSGGPVPEAPGGQGGPRHDISFLSRTQSGTIVDLCALSTLGSSYIPPHDRENCHLVCSLRNIACNNSSTPRNRRYRGRGSFHAHTIPRLLPHTPTRTP